MTHPDDEGQTVAEVLGEFDDGSRPPDPDLTVGELPPPPPEG